MKKKLKEIEKITQAVGDLTPIESAQIREFFRKNSNNKISIAHEWGAGLAIKAYEEVDETAAEAKKRIAEEKKQIRQMRELYLSNIKFAEQRLKDFEKRMEDEKEA